MAGQIRIDDLNALLEAGKALDKLLNESPQIAAFADAVQQAKEPVLVVEHDRLVRAGEASKILCVNRNQISKWVHEGLLKAFYTPGSSSAKFKVSDLWKIPEVRNG